MARELQLRPAMEDILKRHGVTVRRLRALRGPNVYARMPVLHAVMDIGQYEHKPSCDLPGFVERLAAWVPGLAGHGCSKGYPGGFLERLHEGTYLGHIVEHVTL